MKNKILAVLALAAPLSVLAGEKLLVQVPAMLDPMAPIVPRVRAECGVEQLVATHVFGQVVKRFPDAQQLADPRAAGSARLLRLTVVSVSGVGGGGWSGPKNITLRAEVVQEGKSLGSTVLTRNSRGGIMGPAMGTCAILEHIAVALGQDVAAWVPAGAEAQPVPAQAPDAAMGDIKP